MTRFPRHTLTAIVLVVALSPLGCGGDDNGNPAGPGGGGTPADVTITIPSGSQNAGNMAFQPNPATVQLGKTVSWKNNDGVTHTATGSGFNVAISAGGTSTPVTITGATGPRSYQCTVGGHVMTGTLNVDPAP